MQIDYRKVAKAFGTTYDTIENRFRKIKEEALALEKESADGEHSKVTPPRSRPTSSTPKEEKTMKIRGLDCKSSPMLYATDRTNDDAAVATGRVSKASSLKKSFVRTEKDEGWLDTLNELSSEQNERTAEGDYFGL